MNVSACSCNAGYYGPYCLLVESSVEAMLLPLYASVCLETPPTYMRKPSYRSFDLDIKLDIISTPSDLADQTEVMVMELANFFGLDSAARLLVKNESGVVTRRYVISCEYLKQSNFAFFIIEITLNGHFLRFPPVLYD